MQRAAQGSGERAQEFGVWGFFRDVDAVLSGAHI